MGVEWIEHEGKRILHVDLRGLRGEELIACVELEAEMIAAAPDKVLILANVEGASIADLSQIKQLGKEVIGPRTAKSATLGITGLKDILLRAYNKFAGSNSRPFQSETEALDWLVE